MLRLAIGASQDPCSETFAGRAAYSEPESRVLSDYVSSFPVMPFDVFITLHSYGQLFISPWGYTINLSADYTELVRAQLYRDITYLIATHKYVVLFSAHALCVTLKH